MIVRSLLARFAFFALLAGAAMLLPGGGDSASAAENCDAPDAALDASETAMLEIVNAARQSQGLSAWAASPALSRAAAWKSADPSNQMGPPGQFSHTDSLGRGHIQRARDCGYRGTVGENIAVGTANPQTIFDMWMGSTMGHRELILDTQWGFTVAGIARNGTSWTLMAGAYNDSGDPWDTPPAEPTAPPVLVIPTWTPTPPPTATPTPTATPSPTPSPTPIATPPLAHGASAGPWRVVVPMVTGH